MQSQEGLGSDDERKVVLFTSGGAVATQVGTGESRSIEYRIGPKSGGGPKGTIKKAVLFDLLPTKQGPQVLYGALNPDAPTIVSKIALFDIGSGTSTTVIEVAVDCSSVAADAMVPSAPVTVASKPLM